MFDSALQMEALDRFGRRAGGLDGTHARIVRSESVVYQNEQSSANLRTLATNA